MKCTTQITHTIQPGDTLYSLAIRYDTTVSKLLDLNPGIEVYNLPIGGGLIVCQPETPPQFPTPPIATLPPTEKFRELLALILCWLAEQFGEDESRKIITSLYQDWTNGYPC